MTCETPPRAPIVSRQLVLLLVAAFGALCGFYLLVSVVPLYTAGSGGTVGAGLTTATMMLSTVLMELGVPWLLARLGNRTVLGLGLLLLGAPSLALVASPAIGLVLGVCFLRGAGLGIVVVVGSALAAELAPAQRRAEALALYGVVVNVPAVLGIPAGIWLSEHAGFSLVFVTAGVVTLVPLVALSGLSVGSGQAERTGSVLSVMRASGLARPTVIFTTVTFAAGVFATFLPLAVASREVAAIALLVQSLTMALARLVAGRLGDRHGSGPLLIPAVVVSAAGAGLAGWLDSPTATIAGMALFGVGFGVAQNVTLALMIERVEVSQYGRTSALWNLAYDAGFGIGAIGFGLIGDYAIGFVLTAGVLLAAVVPAAFDRRKDS